MPNDSKERGSDARQTWISPRLELVLLKFLEDWSMHSLAVKLLGLLVEWSALLDDCETLDLEFLSGLLTSCDPRRLLVKEALLLADNPACLGLHKVCLLQSSCGLVDLAKEGMTFGKLCR